MGEVTKIALLVWPKFTNCGQENVAAGYISPVASCDGTCLLSKLQNSSADDPLFGLYSWNSSSDCCQWVICATTSESRPVIALYLDSLVFISFFGVTSLMILGISSNYIQGEIPGHAYANLTKLVDLDMKQNSFTGSIPLQNLRELSLEDNRFRGSIPEEIGNLSKLQRLSLRGNSFVEIRQARKNSTRKQLALWLFDNKTLKKLFLGGYNNLTWNNNNNAKIVPKCMLSQLSMKSCGLSGKIPGWISTHKSLLSCIPGFE
ncbi:hypothetical protein QYF36_012004 [Acer negundo]|nr:hypothetical protein QYF36_012004 [Acer negundo]